MSARPSSRQWVGVGIVAIQMAAWCVVGVLLIHRGATNLRKQDANKPMLMVFMEISSGNQTFPLNDSLEVNATLVSSLEPPLPQPPLSLQPLQPPQPPPAKAMTAIIMVVIGTVMLVVGPAFLLVKIVDVFQRQRRFIKVPITSDLPPSYDEVAEKAPRYSALFHIEADGTLSLVDKAQSSVNDQRPSTSQPLLSTNSQVS